MFFLLFLFLVRDNLGNVFSVYSKKEINKIYKNSGYSIFYVYEDKTKKSFEVYIPVIKGIVFVGNEEFVFKKYLEKEVLGKPYNRIWLRNLLKEIKRLYDIKGDILVSIKNYSTDDRDILIEIRVRDRLPVNFGISFGSALSNNDSFGAGWIMFGSSLFAVEGVAFYKSGEIFRGYLDGAFHWKNEFGGVIKYEVFNELNKSFFFGIYYDGFRFLSSRVLFSEDSFWGEVKLYNDKFVLNPLKKKYLFALYNYCWSCNYKSLLFFKISSSFPIYYRIGLRVKGSLIRGKDLGPFIRELETFMFDFEFDNFFSGAIFFDYYPVFNVLYISFGIGYINIDNLNYYMSFNGNIGLSYKFASIELRLFYINRNRYLYSLVFSGRF